MVVDRRLVARLAAAVVLGGLAFWVTREWRLSTAARGEVEGVPPAGTTAPVASGAGRPSGPAPPAPAMVAIVGDGDSSGAGERAHARDIGEAHNALVIAISRSVSERGVSPDDCDAGGELVGDYVIEFETEVDVSADRAVVGRFDLVRVRNGTPLTEAQAACFEALLGGPYTIVRDPAGDPFRSYRGAYPFVYRVSFPTP